MSRSGDVGRVLRACVTEHPWDRPLPEIAALLAGVELGPLLERGKAHAVTNFVYLSIRGSPGFIHPEALGELEWHHKMTICHHLRALADLGSLAATLDGAGIPWMTFKGPFLSEHYYSRPDLRTYHDLDVVVCREDLARAVEVLESVGIRLVDSNWELLVRMQPGQLHLRMPSGTLVDLHWHLLNSSAVRQSMSVSMDSLFRAGRRVEVGRMLVPTLGAADTLLHLCVHSGLAGGVRLLWLKDVERVIASGAVDWDHFMATAEQWRAGAIAGAVLQRAHRTLHARVPRDVISKLAPSRLGRALNDVVDCLWPPERSDDGHSGPAGRWGQYRRDRLSTTAAAVVGRLQWRSLVRTDLRSHGDGGGHAAPLGVPTGGAEGRAAFFEALKG